MYVDKLSLTDPFSLEGQGGVGTHPPCPLPAQIFVHFHLFFQKIWHKVGVHLSSRNPLMENSEGATIKNYWMIKPQFKLYYQITTIQSEGF